MAGNLQKVRMMSNRSKHHYKTQATLAKRTVKVVPVGAWVELGTADDIRGHDAIVSVLGKL